MLAMLLVPLVAQVLFTSGDFLARANLKHQPLALDTFAAWWFVLYLLARTVATALQLYVLSRLELGRSATLFGMSSLILANLLSLLVLHETLKPINYIGVGLALLALVFIAL